MCSLASKIQSLEDRTNNQRDQIATLQLRAGYSECGKHDYKFMGRVDSNKQYLGIYKVFQILLPDWRYRFVCTKCSHELLLEPDDMTQSQRDALRKLGLLEDVPGDRKVGK
jgi:hypothetical protein